MNKLAIIGASYLQKPLVFKAKKMGLETHVFAWEEGNVASDVADYYYPISITEKENILNKCRDIQINGITSIASDLAMPTVNYVAEKLGLVGNSLEATKNSTDKFEMRQALSNAGLPCPQFAFFDKSNFELDGEIAFPVIVKPTDRSGARGVTKVNDPIQLKEAIKKALDHSMSKRAIVEEFVEGREFSIEMISFQGTHYYLALTDKVTTGAPFFVEKEHHQPAKIDNTTEKKIIEVVKKALDVLKLKNGASHSEIVLTSEGEIKIVEIAGRMGGDFIGSEIVHNSTGYDFVRGVILVALNEFVPVDYSKLNDAYSGVYYVFPKPGKIKSISDHSNKYEHITKAISIMNVGDEVGDVIDDASKRAGVIVYSHPTKKINLKPLEVLQFKTL